MAKKIKKEEVIEEVKGATVETPDKEKDEEVKEQETIEEVKDATVETPDKEKGEEVKEQEAPDVVAKKKVKVTYKHGLNVRKKPDLESEVVAVLPFKAEMEVTDEKNGFGKIENGWIMLGFTKEIE